MAVTQDIATFDEFHLSGDDLDALLAANGSPAELSFATRCGCWDAQTGNPDPGCTLCWPFGFLLDSPITTMVYGPSRRGLRREEESGVVALGDAFFTFPTGITPPIGSRLVLPISTMRVDETLDKGKADIIRFAQVVQVEQAHYTRRNPSTGTPYVVERVPLTIGTDFTVSGRQITWPHGSAVPDGTRYVLRLLARTEYMIFEQGQERNENGKPLPGRYLGKRIDYLIHPRGSADLSY